MSTRDQFFGRINGHNMSDLFPVNHYFGSNRAVIWPDITKTTSAFTAVYIITATVACATLSIENNFKKTLTHYLSLNIYDSSLIRHKLNVIRYESVLDSLLFENFYKDVILLMLK